MKVLGVTGGVGSGKSAVLSYLEEQYDAYVCQLDEVAKALQQNGETCYNRIVENFGTGILDEGGQLDRQKLGEIVFGDEKKLKILNEIVHPAVKEWVRNDKEEKEKQGVPLYVIEAALLPEAGYEDICPDMWFIYTREEVRRQRLEASRGYSQEKITNMIASQSSEEVFRRVCRVVIDNSGDFEDTKRQIGEQL